MICADIEIGIIIFFIGLTALIFIPTLENKIGLVVCCLIMIIAFLFNCFVFCENKLLKEEDNADNIKDYSESKLLTYNKITLEENKNDSSDTFYYVYLDNGEKYKINDNIKVMVNTDQLSDCFVPAGTEYIIRNNLAYIYNSVEKDTLYVNQETYNIITSSPNYKTTIIE